MAFDPDTYLAEPPTEFDPDAYLKQDTFDSAKETVSTPADTYHRVMGGLTTGALAGAAGAARWAEMVTKADTLLADKAGLPIVGEVTGAISKEFGGIAQSFEETKKSVQSYSESKRNRERDPLFSAQLAEAGGNFAGQIGVTAMGKVPGIIGNVGQMFEQEYGAAKEKGEDDLTAYQAGVYNMPSAFLDYFTESRMVKSLIPQSTKRTVTEVAKKLFTNAGLEGATEAIQDEYSNWLAGNALKYDQTRSVEERFSAENLPETGKQIARTAAIGGILGGTATGVFEAIQPAPVDEKGLAKESRLEALQKELDLINETQEKAKISTTESSPIIPATTPEIKGDTAPTPVAEVARVSPEIRQQALDEEAEKRLSEAESVLTDPITEETPQMSLGTSESVPVAPITSNEPIIEPRTIPGIPDERSLKKIDVLKRATDVIREGWEHAPQIEVVADINSIPKEAFSKEEIESLKGNISADGVFGKDGKVYIVGENVPSVQRVKELILHETKSHYGFKSLFGSDEGSYRKAMQTALDEFNARPKLADALARRRGGFKDLGDLMKAYSHLNAEHKEGKYALTEELLSRAAEIYHDPAKARPTWFNRVISRIKVALQPIMPGMHLNDQDIVNLLGTKSTELLDAAGEKVETGKADIPKFSLTKNPAPAVHIGDQEFEGQKFPFFNLTEDIPGHPKDSTVSADTLLNAGYAAPEGYSGGFEKSNLPQFSLTKTEDQRKFTERQKENPHFEEVGMADLVEKIDSNYAVISNKEGAEKATKTLGEIGIQEAMDRVDSDPSMNARERQYLGIAAMEYWNNISAQATKDGDQEMMDVASRNMVHVIESLARRGTEYGQAIQAMRGRLTPEGWIRTSVSQFKEKQKNLRAAGKYIVDGFKKEVSSKEKQIIEAVEKKPRIKKLVEDFEKKSTTEAEKEIRSVKDIIFETSKSRNLTVEQLTKSLVDQSGLTGKEAEALANAVISAANAEIGKQAASYINRLKKTNSSDKKIVKAMKDDITKIMDYSISGILDDEVLYNHLAEKMGLPFYDQKFIQEIKSDAEKIKDDELINKSPMLKNKAIHDLGNKIAKRTGTSNYDIAQSYWYASVLSGIRTQLKNFIGTAGQGQLNNFLLSADAVRRGQLGEVTAIYSGWLDGLQKGVASASDALLKGDFTGQYSFEAQRAANALENISESPDKWKRIVSNFKYVSRLMVAADILNASANSESRIRLKAYQSTGDINQSKEDRQKAIAELLHTTPNEIKTAQLQAEKEGFKPETSTFKRRVNEILELQRPSDLVSEAKAYGLSATYNSEPNPNTVLGTLANFIENSIAAGNRSESVIPNISAKAARYLIPFTRIVANVGNEQLNYTPVGLLRLATQGHFNKGIEQTETDLNLLRAKVLLGNGMLIGLAAILSQWDDDPDPPLQIVGAGPSDPEKKKQWLAAGNKPWSIIWKDKNGKKHTATYTYTPFAMMLGTLGSYKDSQRYGNINEKSAITKLASAVSGGAVVITDASFLSGVTSLMDVYSRRKDVESFSKGLVSQFARTTGGLVPNLLKEMDSWWNKPLRDTKASGFEMGAIFANQVPVIKDVIGKPMLNILGEEVKNPKYPWEPFSQTKEMSDVWRVLDKKQNDGVFISLPDAATKILPNGKRQTMNNQELYEYRKAYGEEMKKLLNQNLSFFEKADPETSKELLQDWADSSRSIAKTKIKFQ